MMIEKTQKIINNKNQYYTCFNLISTDKPLAQFKQ